MSNVELADLTGEAEKLDAADPLAHYRSLFVGHDDTSVPAYLDGNSLGRPLRASLSRMQHFMEQQWGGRLIRGWDESWLKLPERIGDDLGRVALGAAPGQTVVADSTTVLLYKLASAALQARPGRAEIVIDRDNFPTDRFIVDGLARQFGLNIKWVEADVDGGVTAEALTQVVGPDTALVVLSHVAYRSGFVADVADLTRIVHAAGALMLWDLCHSVGVIPMDLDRCAVDLAVGCTYKYLNGGPGSPAFAYVNRKHHGILEQPIHGWIGSDDPFGMGERYRPAAGIRAFTSGTPPILGMLSMQDMIALIDDVGVEAIRTKAIALTEFAISLVDDWLVPLGVTLSSPREADWRGSHITIDHPRFEQMTGQLWEQGIIPDFRYPSGLRLGMSPLSTSFAEAARGVEAIRVELSR